MLENNCLIIDKMHDSILPLLEKAGWKGTYMPDIKRPEILQRVGAYQGLILRSKTMVDAELLAQAPQLRVVARAGSGVDLMDMQALTQRNITLVNAPEGNRDALAEHATGLLLGLLHRLRTGHNEIARGEWNREGNRGFELTARTVGLIGYGYMGQAFAQRLAAFGCKILAYDKYKTGFGTQAVQEATLEEIFERADVLSLHVPLTGETRFMVDQAFFERFAMPLFFVNTSRGNVVKLNDLVSAMKQGKVLGAALDVLENEKLATLSPEQQATLQWLTQAPNTLITPHVGGWTHESYRKINEVLAEKMAKLVPNKSVIKE